MLNTTQQCGMNALIARGIPFRYAEEPVLGLGERSFDECFKAAWNAVAGSDLANRIFEPYIEEGEQPWEA